MPSSFVGELFGTMILVLLGNGVVANVVLNQTKGNSAGWIVITTGWAFAVMSGVFTAAALGSPGADLNPAVTIAVMVRGGYDVMTGLLHMVAQVIGAILGATLVWLAYLPHWPVTKDPGAKLACFSTGPAIRNPTSNVITEVIGTFVLVFVIFAIFSANGATAGSPASGVGPYLVASLVWGIGLSLGGPTGYAINPARDLGPRIAHAILPIAGKGDSDWSYSWVPVVGPLIGGVIAAVLAIALGM
ncbi:MIP/aquaporin family protein [Candidatus Chloroploca asiatica]|uniref:Aquaporin n=1 Tax=Candidatus Chloroploca asiatica TaxID=1506545 RepID=A0A2H3KPV5_9CHLR|nr:MIP/aquaporin family protein [Candidatus Chloroploca asiatica]PDW00335.1 aquaporin [Candidatus Chloroploca asiatica]